MIAALLCAVVFACSAACGIALAQTLCSGVESFEGAPEPSRLSPAVPVITFAVLGIIMALRGAGALQLGTVALVGVALAGSWHADAKHGIVPDLFTLVPLGIIAIAVMLHHTWFIAVSALVTGGAFAIAALLSRGRGMGWGDAKLAAVSGALLGLPWSLGVLGVACFGATVVAVVRHRGTKPIAFAPYIVVACLSAIALTVHG
jgi:prepilin signal peptidase PulO-like enzyme (type II secretory pathway)